ncbi:MAG: NADH:ubiquinone reductase (Na(+)-transporting) subunit A [Marinilabiliales bacterium]|nr:MAG: NADH:ubiquinone reductase (Na(+)-transporting) subunit A [Marinilabiliales bacterium]
MSNTIRIRKGLNIRLLGKAEKIYTKAAMADTYAVKPTDFPGVIPKMLVKEGESVKAGTALFFDKYQPEVMFASPVSGTVQEIKRGERRRILEVIIKADTEISYEKFEVGDLSSMSAEEVRENLLKSGLWPSIRQRPYAVIAKPVSKPKSIFIPCFDTAPLAADPDFLVKDNKEDFQMGVDALKKLTDGKINLTLSEDYQGADVFTKAKGVEFHRFSGPHPAGSVGVQIHHIDPINKGEIVWYVDPQHVISIGKLFKSGHYDASRIVAVTGSEVERPRYYKTFSGVDISALHANRVKEGSLRYISGNVLTGTQIESNGYNGYYDSQITIIPEGDDYEFLGWASPGFGKFSTSRTFWSWLSSGKRYRLNANYHGGERAFVMTGEYEKVLPMDILPVHLLKAILAEDIDKMEQLGIYEVAEEDMALCEFVCTSKIEVQSILRKGIDLMIKELG